MRGRIFFMVNERKRILKLVENGTISAEEAIVLLEALSKQKESAQQPVILAKEQQEQKQEPAAQTEVHDAEPIFEEAKKEQKTTGFEDIFGELSIIKISIIKWTNL